MSGGAFPWPEACRPAAEGTYLSIRVTPRSSRDEITGIKEGQLQIRVNAPPAEGKANRAVIELVAEAAGLPPSRLEVVKGQSSRQKVIFLRGWRPF